jgi:hypothetical protein
MVFKVWVFKCNLHRYSAGSPAPSDSQLREMTADVRAAASYCSGAVGVEAGLYKFANPVYP